MRPYLFIVISFFLVVFNSKGQDCNKSEANTFVDGLFKKGQYLSYDSTEFRGYSKELKFVNTPLLNKLLPDYCFYSTTFLSNYYEYLDVKTALAFSKKSSKKSLFIHSPVFTTESSDFIHLFYGLSVSDSGQEVTLANEIMSLFSDITYGGHFNRLINLKDTSVISFELWRSDLSWRIYDFDFDFNNKLTQIKINGGVKREEMKDGYKRQ